MPKVPYAEPQAIGSNVRRLPPKIDPTILAMTAAMMHKEGRFFKAPEPAPESETQ